MRIHFIAIGGSAMHNLAIALKIKGYTITGSDDEIFEPSLSRLKNHGILPETIGWNPARITPELDAVVLGMHARKDNPELLKAEELGLKIFSYPEYLYEQTRNKTRVVIGGSHGKTTITSMVMHVLKNCGTKFDYMVGAQLEGFENMVSLSEDSQVAVFEGDEYLTSPIDLRPKFHLYKPHIALISGIAWDHINAFPTFEIYREQFNIFVNTIEPHGSLVFCSDDKEVEQVSQHAPKNIKRVAYTTHPFKVENSKYILKENGNSHPVEVFGSHNMQNIAGAQAVCKELGISSKDFYEAIATFKGASKRLQLLAENSQTKVFLDFAHSPSKVSATVKALREAYPERELVACLELHTFSSLNPNFLGEYKDMLQGADLPIVYFNPETLQHKKLPEISTETVSHNFGNPKPEVFTNSERLIDRLKSIDFRQKNLLIMTSGNFSGVNLRELASLLVLT